MRLKDILNSKPIVESQIKVGTMFMVHGYPLLKGLFPQQHYKVTAINGDNVTMEKVNFQGKETNLTTTPVTHKLSSIEAAIQGGENSDMNGLEIVNEATSLEIIKDLDKVKNDLLKKVDVLVAKKKKLYSNVDIESPMSADEKKLDKEIADIFSQIQQLILQKRKIKESVNEGSLYSSQQLIQKLTPKIEKDIELLKKQFPKYDIRLTRNYYETDGSYTLSISGKNTSDTDNKTIQKVVASKIKESVNEGWEIKDGKVTSNGKLIGYYEFDRDSDSFWVDDVKKGKGQISFDTKKQIEDYYKKYIKDALKSLEKLRGKYESIKETKMIKLKDILNEAKFPIYHKTYTSAINSALEWAEKSGFEYDKEETAQKIGLGPKKPSDGKTNRFSIGLTKGGKEQKKMLHIQVYNMGTFKRNSDGSKTRSMWGGQNEYELNCYIG